MAHRDISSLRRHVSSRPAVEQVDEIAAQYSCARVWPPSGVPVGRRRGRVGIRYQKHRIQAGLVDVVSQVIVVEASLGTPEDP